MKTDTPLHSAQAMISDACDWLSDLRLLAGDERAEAIEQGQALLRGARALLSEQPAAAFGSTLALFDQIAAPVMEGKAGASRFRAMAARELIPSRHGLALRREAELARSPSTKVA